MYCSGDNSRSLDIQDRRGDPFAYDKYRLDLVKPFFFFVSVRINISFLSLSNFLPSNLRALEINNILFWGCTTQHTVCVEERVSLPASCSVPTPSTEMGAIYPPRTQERRPLRRPPPCASNVQNEEQRPCGISITSGNTTTGIRKLTLLSE